MSYRASLSLVLFIGCTCGSVAAANAENFDLLCERSGDVQLGNYPSLEVAEEIHPATSRFRVTGDTVRTDSYYNEERGAWRFDGTVRREGRRYNLMFEVNTPDGRFGYQHIYIPHTGVYVQQLRTDNGQIIGESRGTCTQS